MEAFRMDFLALIKRLKVETYYFLPLALPDEGVILGAAVFIFQVQRETSLALGSFPLTSQSDPFYLLCRHHILYLSSNGNSSVLSFGPLFLLIMPSINWGTFRTVGRGS